jgi:hypothetical protein
MSKLFKLIQSSASASASAEGKKEEEKWCVENHPAAVMMTLPSLLHIPTSANEQWV